jgi:hypothetical protein
MIASSDGSIRLWNLDYRDTIRALCLRIPRDFTEDERAQYSVLSEKPTCPTL